MAKTRVKMEYVVTEDYSRATGDFYRRTYRTTNLLKCLFYIVRARYNYYDVIELKAHRKW